MARAQNASLARASGRQNGVMRTIALLLVVAVSASACTAAAPPAPATDVASPTPRQGLRATTPPSPAADSTPSASPSSDATQPVIAGLINELRSENPRLPLGAATLADLEALVASDTDFAFRLYQQVVSGESGDVFLSPYSISTALSMAYAGARAETATEIAEVMGIELEPATWHAARNRLELELAAAAGRQYPAKDAVPLTLDPTNAIFGQAGFAFEEDYLDLLAANYGAAMQTVDFASAPEPARVAINEWVAERTRDRIEQLLGQDTIDTLTRFVLVNAIYFKAGWTVPFLEKHTESAPFHQLDGTMVDVQMMHTDLSTSHARGDGWQAVRLYYFGASMLVIVPDEGRFESFEEGLNRDVLANVEGRMESTQVELGLPRWESESSVNLTDILKGMGIRDLFDPEAADLSGIAPPDDLHVSDVVHQANVTVDEEGTEAAAATAVIGGVTSGPGKQATLTIDRPFIYLIYDAATNEILFMGRVLSPSGD
jgi:serpin B